MAFLALLMVVATVATFLAFLFISSIFHSMARPARVEGYRPTRHAARREVVGLEESGRIS